MKTMSLNVKRQKGFYVYGFYVYGKFSPVLLFFRKILSGCQGEKICRRKI